MTRKVHIKTYGCQMNVYDSQRMADVLAPLGYAFTFGRFGLPEMGAAGLGVASAIMMWGQAIAFASGSKHLAVRSLVQQFADLEAGKGNHGERAPLFSLVRRSQKIFVFL